MSTPEGWRPGDDVIEVPDLDLSISGGAGEAGAAWFYRTRKTEQPR